MKSTTADRSYRPDIDGIRSIAILSVVLYHAGLPAISGGFTGVDIFFVISGYLIGGHIFAEARTGSFSFQRFYQRRAKRILPAFYVVLLFTTLVALVLLSPGEATVFGRYAFSATLSGSNIFFWHYLDYFDHRSALHPLLMTWSLGVEEQFYAVIPLLMVLLARIRRSLMLPAILAACALSFALAWWELGSHPLNVFYLLPERAWELGIGVALAVKELTRKSVSAPAWLANLLSLVGTTMVFAPMFLLNGGSAFPGPSALPSVLGTALIIATPSSWISQKLLSLPPLVFIGRVSYSWYLWHWPMLSYLRICGGGELPATAGWLAIAASLGAATLSYHVVEQPFRNSKRAPGPLLLRYALVSLLILAVCAGLWLSNGLPRRLPQLAEVDREARASTHDPCLAGHDKMNLGAPCYEAAGSRPAVALWGDSHSAALAPALRELAQAQGYDFFQLGHAGCLPLTGAANYTADNPPGAAECMRFNGRALSVIENDPRIRFVVLAGRWTDGVLAPEKVHWLVSDLGHPEAVPSEAASRALFEQSLATSLQGLISARKQVLLIGDVPNFDFDPMMRFRSARIPARRALAAWMGEPSANDPGRATAGNLEMAAQARSQVKLALQGFGDVQLFDPTAELCDTSNQCAYREGEHPYYFDSQHLTREGARRALRGFRFPAHNRAGE